MTRRRFASPRYAVLWGSFLVAVIAACSSPETGERPVPSTTRNDTEETKDTASAVPGSEWETISPSEAGLNEEALDQIAEGAEATGSYCLSVVRDGKMAYQRTFGDYTASTPQEAYSVTKSFTSTLVGMAAEDGDLDVGQAASDFLPEWQGTDSADVTVRNLIQNDSGRFWSLKSDYLDMMRATDLTQFALDLDQAEPPGTVWRYNNAAIQTLPAVMFQATGQSMGDFGAGRLLKPLGMAHSSFTADQAGNTLAFMGLQSTCDDLARFGLLFDRGGVWGDDRLVSADWVQAATTPGELNPAYGYLWWLQTDGAFTGGEGKQLTGHYPDAPPDTFAAEGLGGQVVVVVPSEDLVITRMAAVAAPNPTGDPFAESLPADVVAAINDAESSSG